MSGLLVDRARGGAGSDRGQLEGQLEQHRAELTGYCYRMLGSAFDSEDAVQETMVRAWRGLDRFDGRSALRSWLYRIATNVCYDALNGRKRRALPIDIGGPSAPVVESLAGQQPETEWVEPIPDNRVLPSGADPAETAVARESIRLAFVAALQHLPARQRAVLILREVLCWKASEVAELLDATVASVNSALQRARVTMSAEGAADHRPDPMDDAQQELLTRYVEAFERFDMASLIAVLHEDAVQSMPPYEMWLRSAADIAAWMRGPGCGCRGSRLVPVQASGMPAFAQYRPSGPDGALEAWGIQVLRIQRGRVAELTVFLDTKLFAFFGLPERL